MKTLDQILFDLPENIPTVDKKSMRVLNGFKKYIKSHGFLTENQANYLLILYKDNVDEFTKFSDDLVLALETPIWSQPFKRIFTERTINLIRDENGNKCIEIKFTYSNGIRRILTNSPLAFNIKCPGSWYTTKLTEHGLVYLIDALFTYGFVIDKPIMDLYNEIKSWNLQDAKDKFTPAEMGIAQFDDIILNYDRRLYHQYVLPDPPAATNLTEKIAYRSSANVWIDLHKNPIHDIIDSILYLQRLPLMVVLPSSSYTSSYKWLCELSSAIDHHKIENVGVYHRKDGDCEFNTLISNKQYNARLDEQTNIAVCQQNKLPKIFLSTGWKPMAVLVIDNELRVNAVANYAKQFCDLIITASYEPPLMGSFFNR
jgi:hypothetical protein